MAVLACHRTSKPYSIDSCIGMAVSLMKICANFCFISCVCVCIIVLSCHSLPFSSFLFFKSTFTHSDHIDDVRT